MKSIPLFTLIMAAAVLSSCGHKGNKDKSQISEQYLSTLMTWQDVDNKSTLDLSALPANLPRIIDLKDDMTKVKDQDMRGTCSFFASVAAVESAIKKKMKVEVNLSEEFFNYTVKSSGVDPLDEGSWPANNLRVAINKHKGFMLEKDWPYQPSWFGQKAPCVQFEANDSKAPAVCFSHDAPPEKLLSRLIPADQFENLELNSGETNDIILALAEEKIPLIISVPVNNIGWPNSGETSYTEEMRQGCIKKASDCGYHSIVLTGYDLDKKVFFFRNSWSKNWGKEGYGTIPFSVIDRHVKQHLSAVRLKDKIVLPEDYNQDEMKLDSFVVTAHETKEGSVIIRPEGKMMNIGHHTILMGATLFQLDLKKGRVPGDDTADAFEISEADKKTHENHFVSNNSLSFAEQERNEVDLYQEFFGKINWSAEDMSIPSVKSFMLKERSKAFARTTLYLYTDDSKYKILKREYLPITY